MCTEKAFPKKVFSGYNKGGHVQGIAIDEKNGFVYYSFTTMLLKTDFDGNTVGSVRGIAGHLGCIVFDSDKGLLYGTLELKHDIIGKNISTNIADEDSFYCVCFDCDKINKTDMNAESDGIMTAVYLPDVVKDYSDTDEASRLSHRYGCSGIDGIAYGPEFGGKDSKLMIAYGIYGDVQRTDNDYQVILQFSPNIFELYGKPLTQLSPHHSGTVCEKKYFFYTGNTTYGIQNLEYDSYTKTYIAAVYRGKKAEFVNYPMFFIDGTKRPEMKELKGRNGEAGLCLSPANPHSSIADSRGGCEFKWGQTGIYSFGDGRYAFSHGETHSNEDGYFASEVFLYKFDRDGENVFSI